MLMLLANENRNVAIVASAVLLILLEMKILVATM
jgi:hypothetical protein